MSHLLDEPRKNVRLPSPHWTELNPEATRAEPSYDGLEMQDVPAFTVHQLERDNRLVVEAEGRFHEHSTERKTRAPSHLRRCSRAHPDLEIGRYARAPSA